MSRDLSQLRKSYNRASLDDEQALADPFRQFELWLGEALASGIAEPNAMTLATVSQQGRPSTRIVLIKGFDQRGPVWYTNYQSRKGNELAGNPYAALQFHWVELERVVRIEGIVEPVARSDSEAYFASRPLDSRIGAWASPQSQPIQNRAELMKRVAKAAAQYKLSPPCPPHWGGYRLQPDRWEFWQGRSSRLHDRMRYLPVAGGGWERQRLAP